MTAASHATPGADIAYLEAGEGVAILFLHGIGGAARQFTPQIAHFRHGFRAIAWDMPGYGASAPLPVVTMATLAAALKDLICSLRLDRPVLVGHSIGGMIAQQLLVKEPRIARALVLAQTSAAFGGKDPAWARSFVANRLAPLDAGATMVDLAPEMVAALLGEAPDPDGVTIATSCIMHTPEQAYRDTVMAMPGFDLRHALPEIAVPTLVLAGTLDRNAPAPAMQRMAERIPDARYVALEGVGHLAHLEQPARFNAALDAFLKEIPA